MSRRRQLDDALLICEGRCSYRDDKPTAHRFLRKERHWGEMQVYHIYGCLDCGRQRIWGCEEFIPGEELVQ